MDDDGDRHHKTLYNIRLGMRYHMRRQGFFERCHRLVGVTSLIGGSTSVAALYGNNSPVAIWASAIIAVSQAFDLIFDLRKSADVHNKLRQRYCLLEPELLGKSTLTEEEFKDIQTKLKNIEVDEPPPKLILIGICQDGLNDELSYTADEAPLSYSRHGFFKTAIAHIW